ncbi:MAG TPA: MFS transporter, partial [Candidatus Acidoferrales bacterium]|nr:MFS transporter [Candidatus Acidoferrales bacterium]
SMETELHLSASQGQWIVSTYAIFLAGFLMLTGRCADLYGRYKFFVIGLALFTVGSLAGGLAQNGAMLIAMRAVQGLGAALVNPAALAIVLQMFPSGPARSRAIALWGTIGSSGVAAGVLFGGILVQYLGWRSVMFFNVPIAIVILVLAARFIPRDTPSPLRTKLDVAGATLLTLSLVSLVYTIELIPADGFTSQWTLLRLAITALLFGAFLFVERRAEEPILPPRLFKFPDLLSGAFVVSLQPMSYAGVLVFTSVYLQRVSGYSPLIAGFAFLPSTLVTSFIAAPLTMPIVRKIGVKPMGILMAAVMTAGESILLLLQPHSSYWLVMFPATCIAAFGGMLAYQTGMIAGLAHVDDADEGCASAALSFALQIGIGFGVAFGAAAQELIAGAMTRAGSAPLDALAGGLHATFWVSIGFGVATLAAAIVGLRHAAAAETPIRPHLPFGKLVHRAATKA